VSDKNIRDVSAGACGSARQQLEPLPRATMLHVYQETNFHGRPSTYDYCFLLVLFPAPANQQVRNKNRKGWGSYVETLMVCNLGFSQNYYMFAAILLIDIVLGSKIQ